MDSCDGRQGGEFFRELRIDLHRARAERIEPRVDSEVHLRQPCEVPHHVVVREVGDRQSLAPQFRWHEIGEVQRDVWGGAFLHEERFVPVGLSEAHLIASRAATNFATASGVCRPVVANRAASCNSGSWRVSGNPPWMPLSRRVRWTSAYPFLWRTTNSLKWAPRKIGAVKPGILSIAAARSLARRMLSAATRRNPFAPSTDR